MNEIIQRVVDRIVERFSPRRVILFGSHASATADPLSDLDLLVVSEPAPGEPLDARRHAVEIRRCLADFPLAFDIVVSPAPEFERFRRVVNHIAYIADRHGQVVYER